MNVEDAIEYIIDWVRAPRRNDYSSYGYEIYLPTVITFYLRESLGNDGIRPDDARVIEHSPPFYDACWYLCRLGLLRPQLKKMGLQATDDGGSGNGYAVTSVGRAWIAAQTDKQFIPTEPSRFAGLIEGFRRRFGDGFFQRSQEAVRCHFAGANLACCAMVGAAIESIMLRVAIGKAGDEESVLRRYRAASGRRTIENEVTGQLREPLKGQLLSQLALIAYWRDDAAHGQASVITEFEAYEALARLLRLAHLVDDHWAELTARQDSAS